MSLSDFNLSNGKRMYARFSRNVRRRIDDFLSRRPHRSFRRTHKRDYTRTLVLPGYVALSAQVLSVLRTHRVLFIKLIALYAVLNALFLGFSSQSSYDELSQLLNEQDWSNLTNGWTALGQGAVLLFLGLSGNINAELTDIQQVYAGIIFLLTWLSAVWLLRSALAGNRPTLRDGLYNAGAPIVPTAIVMFVLLLQLLPAAAGIVAYSAASSSGLLENGFLSMIGGLSVALLCLLSLYWAVSTFFALVIVTLPGMYPWKALRSAGDIVTGRRLRILLRIMWMFLVNVVALIVFVIPIVLIDRWLRSSVPLLAQIPIVPVAISIMSSVIVVWSAAYIYILYRKVVEDDSSPS